MEGEKGIMRFDNRLVGFMFRMGWWSVFALCNGCWILELGWWVCGLLGCETYNAHVFG